MRGPRLDRSSTTSTKRKPTIGDLYAQHRGKVSDKWSAYLREYERLFTEFQSTPVRLLEIGVQNGGSLEIWAKYFSNARKLVGCDIDPRCSALSFDDPRIVIIIGDANDDAISRRIARYAPLDIIIDDGSHRSGDIVRFFARYFQLLRNGGIYVVEDLHASYWKSHGGGLYHPYSAVAFFKRLVDYVNQEHWGIAPRTSDPLAGFHHEFGFILPQELIGAVHSIEFLDSMCVIRKEAPGRNNIGRRLLAGTLADVEPEPNPAPSPDESQNAWTALTRPPEELYVELRQRQSIADSEIANLQSTLSARDESLTAAAAALDRLTGLLEDSLSRVTELEANESKARRLEDQLEANESKARRLEDQLEANESKARRLEGEILALQQQLDNERGLATAAKAEVAQATQLYAQVLGSRSWRLTGPLRTLKRATLGVGASLGSRFGQTASGERADVHPVPLDRPNRVAYRIDHNGSIHPGDDILIYAAYAPSGLLSPLHMASLTTYHQLGYKIVLVINSGAYHHYVDPGPSPAVVQIVRENIGYDFGAWSHAVSLLGGLEFARTVTFTNDSVVGPLNNTSANSVRGAIIDSRADVVFLTGNTEIRPHLQSYFFALTSGGLRKGGLDVLRDQPVLETAELVIMKQEVPLADRFHSIGLTSKVLFDSVVLNDGRNPTIHYWQQLLRRGFPFVKARLVTEGLVRIDDGNLSAALGEDWLEALREHLGNRSVTVETRALESNVPPEPAITGVTRLAANGAVQAYNPPIAQPLTIAVPLLDLEEEAPRSAPHRILAMIHAYYVDVAERVLSQVGDAGVPVRIVLTTDTNAKARDLERVLDTRRLVGNVVVVPNRGRDVAPLLIEGGRYLGDEDIVLHLHTKKSPHDTRYADWGAFLLGNLIGSREIVMSNLLLLDQEGVGVVYSDHFPPVASLRNWGYDFMRAHRILERLEVPFSADNVLDFPTGSMFWARADVLRPLIALGLSYEDFDEELGQTDGTLAHAIERCLLLVAEHQGYRHLRVLAGDPMDGRVVRARARDLGYLLRRHGPRLLSSRHPHSRFYSAVREVYPVAVALSRDESVRINVLIPTMKPAKIYGGIATAVSTVQSLMHALSEPTDLRLIVTSDDVDHRSMQEISKRLERSFVLADPNYDVPGDIVVDIYSRRHLPLILRRRDVFFATAWWTADLAFRLRADQSALFGVSSHVVYLVQDFEPGFYQWSSKYALAENTYRHGQSTIAIVNSEELANFFKSRYEFAEMYHLPYLLNSQVSNRLQPTVKEPLIVVYGRPGTPRNLFEIAVEGLRLWQGRNPPENCAFAVVFAGEDIQSALITDVENARVAGQLSLDEYASLLNRAAIGLSLMLSPHPSYPPLEMAAAGCITITNAFDAKDLSKRTTNLLSISTIAPEAIADALDKAVQRIDVTHPTSPVQLRDVATPVPKVDFAALARRWIGSE